LKTPITDMIADMAARGEPIATIIAAVRAVESSGQRSTAAANTPSRGTRLPDDWQPSERDIAYALDRGMTRDRIAVEAEKFQNYWCAKVRT
jgi:hypothetical protein